MWEMFCTPSFLAWEEDLWLKVTLAVGQAWNLKIGMVKDLADICNK